MTKDFPKAETYALVSQMRRAAASIPTNISEGCGRDSDTEFGRFLTIASGSACETEYLLILAFDLNYLNQDSFHKLNADVNLIKKQIYSLKQKLK